MSYLIVPDPQALDFVVASSMRHVVSLQSISASLDLGTVSVVFACPGPGPSLALLVGRVTIYLCPCLHVFDYASRPCTNTQDKHRYNTNNTNWEAKAKFFFLIFKIFLILALISEDVRRATQRLFFCF